MKRIHIVSMEHNRFDTDHLPTDPDALYSWGLRKIGDDETVGSSATFKELEPICVFFGASTPEKLKGLVYEIPDDIYVELSLEYLALLCKGGGVYTPPSAEEIVARAITALANFELPDYSDVDGMTVCHAFGEGFDFFSLREEWFDKFCQAVKERSQKGVHIERANVKEFTLTIRGPAVYLHLVRGEEKRRMTFGPYSTPFSFDPDAEEFKKRLNDSR